MYMAEPMNKKYFITFTPFPLFAPVHILDFTPPFPNLRTCLMDGVFLNQKTSNIQINYFLKFKHLKKSFLQKNKW